MSSESLHKHFDDMTRKLTKSNSHRFVGAAASTLCKDKHFTEKVACFLLSGVFKTGPYQSQVHIAQTGCMDEKVCFCFSQSPFPTQQSFACKRIKGGKGYRSRRHIMHRRWRSTPLPMFMFPISSTWGEERTQHRTAEGGGHEISFFLMMKTSQCITNTPGT